MVYMDNEDDLLGAVGLSSPLSLPYALDEAVPRMAAAVDGDPKTKVKEVRVRAAPAQARRCPSGRQSGVPPTGWGTTSASTP